MLTGPAIGATTVAGGAAVVAAAVAAASATDAPGGGGVSLTAGVAGVATGVVAEVDGTEPVRMGIRCVKSAHPKESSCS